MHFCDCDIQYGYVHISVQVVRLIAAILEKQVIGTLYIENTCLMKNYHISF